MQRAVPLVLVLLAVAADARAAPAPAATQSDGSATADSAGAPATLPSNLSGADSAAAGRPAGPVADDRGGAPPDTQASPAPSAPASPAVPLPPLPLPPNTARLAVSGVLGRTVDGPDRQDIGRVVDVLVDSSGQPRAAVIDFGGFMGLGSRKIAVEWGAFRFPPGGSDARLSIALTPEEIKNTPEYAGSSKPVAVVGPGTPEPRPGP